MPAELTDGATVRDFETADVGGWGTVKGKYRPASPAEIRAFSEGEGPGLMARHGNSARVDAEFFARRVVAWDVEDADGKPADPSDPENYLMLPFPVFGQLGGLIAESTAPTAV